MLKHKDASSWSRIIKKFSSSWSSWSVNKIVPVDENVWTNLMVEMECSLLNVFIGVCYIRMSCLYLRWGWVVSSWTPRKSSATIISFTLWHGCLFPSFVIADTSLCKELQPLRCNHTLKTASFDQDMSFIVASSFAGFINFTPIVHFLMCTCSHKPTSHPIL